MKDIDILKVVAQIGTLVRPQYPQRQTEQCPDVHRVVCGAVVMGKIMHLGMTIMTAGNAVVGPGGDNLVILELPVVPSGISETRLEKTAATTAAVVVGLVRGHFDDIFLTDDGLDHKAQIICHLIPIALADDLAGILDGKGDLALAIPLGAGFEPAFSDPLGVVGVD